MKKLMINGARSGKGLSLVLFLQCVCAWLLISSFAAQAAAPTDVPSLVASWGKHPVSQMKDPQKVAVDQSGNIYVLDKSYQDVVANEKRQWLYKYDSSGKFLKKFSVKLSIDVAIGINDTILTLDESKKLINQYSKNGVLVEQKNFMPLIKDYLAKLSTISELGASNIKTDKNGNVYLAGDGLSDPCGMTYCEYSEYLIKFNSDVSKVLKKWSLNRKGMAAFEGIDFVANDGKVYGLMRVNHINGPVSYNNYVLEFDTDGSINTYYLDKFDEVKVSSIAKNEKTGSFLLAAAYSLSTYESLYGYEQIYEFDPAFSKASYFTEKYFHNSVMTLSGDTLIINAPEDYSSTVYQTNVDAKIIKQLFKHNHRNASLDYPRSLFSDGQNNLYVLDIEEVGDLYGDYAALKKYDAEGQLANIGSIPYPYTRVSSIKKTTNNEFIASVVNNIDSDESDLKKFDSNGQVVNGWRSNLSLENSAIIALDKGNNIYVTDKYFSKTITKLDKNGNLIKAFAIEYFGTLLDMVIDNDGNFYILNKTSIVKLNKQGKLIAKWGDSSTFSFISNAANLSLDSLNQLYVVDAGNQQIQKFDSNGNFLAKWKTPDQPVAVAVGATDNDVYVSLRDGLVLHYQY